MLRTPGARTRPHSRPLDARIGVLAAAALVAAMLTVVPLPQSLTPRADAVAALDISQSMPGNTLIGSETPVTVTARNTGDTTAYNLALTVTVPLGISVSSSDQAPTRSFATTDAGGTPTGTAYVWENLVDIKPTSFYTFHYSLQHETTGPDAWSVNDTVQPVPVRGDVSDDDSVIPQVNPSGGDPVTPVVTDSDHNDSATGSTTLVPILLTKSEPSPENELLRGVHDHQTVYTLSAQSGDEAGVVVTNIEDWLPAGLEFLGCGDVDNSSGVEYPGAGSLIQGTDPGSTCQDPATVETVNADPDGAGPLASGVYTHVVWTVSATFAANETKTLTYVAGIPQRENTTAWPGATPANNGPQAANLDNNTGAYTTQVGDGTTYTNHAVVDASFDSGSGPESASVTADETVQAVDLALQKVVDTPTIEQGGISTWTLRFRSSEYVVDAGITGLGVTDTTPDGTCPIDTVDHGGAGCTSLTSPGPSLAYKTPGGYAYDASTGKTALSWDVSSRTFGPNETGQISFSTVALQKYHNGQNVQANDSWVNTTAFTANAETFRQFGPLGPTDNPVVTDDSSREQAGTAVQFTKDVGVPGDGQQCDDGSAITWDPDLADGVGPGDRVCFRLTAIAPDYLNTGDVSLVDFLPPGFRYESSAPGTDNEVPALEVPAPTVTGTPANGQRVAYSLRGNLDVQPAQTAQVILSAVLDGGSTPDLGTNGTEITNNARYSFQNSNGEVFVVPDSASIGFEEAHVTLTKGISQVTKAADPGNPIDYSPPTDPARDVVAGDQVTYAVTVTNTGERAATDVDVWDLLPRGVSTPTPPDATCAQIDVEDGACSQADGRIEWTVPTLAATGEPGDTVVLHYTWTLPGTVSIAEQWTNHAGVVQYQAADNNGGPFTYVPRDNIDPAGHPSGTWNTDRADDTANVFSPGITLTKSRTTSVDEPGNDPDDQATIGEVITYTLDTRQPAGTSVDNYRLEDDLVGTGQTLVPGSVRAAAVTATPPGSPCTYPTPLPAHPEFENGNGILVTDTGIVTPADTDACLRLTFQAVVEDVPDDPGEPLNTRPNSVTNTADLTYDVDVDNDGTVDGSGDVHASVDTQVVEPDIAIDKRSTNTSAAQPGSTVTYQLVVTNNSGTAVSRAHDMVVTDDFGTIPTSGVIAGGNPDNGNVAGTTITWNATTTPALLGLDPGESVTLSYTIRLNTGLDAGTTFTNGARVTTTSLTGTPAGERSGRDAGGCSDAGTCPGYVDTDSVTLEVAGPSITKDTTTPLVTVGDTARYVVRATFGAGLNFGPSRVVDDLAGGDTTFVRTVSVDCANCSAAELAQIDTPEDNNTDVTDTPTWELGDLPAVSYARVYVITYDARVEEQSPTAPQAGDSLTNTATLSYTTNPADTQSDDATIEIAEPSVTLVKNVQTNIDTGFRHTTAGTPARGETGGTVTYRLTLTNGSTNWPAYDVHVEDEPDTVRTTSCAADTAVPPQVSVPTGGITAGSNYSVEDGTLSNAGDWCLGFDIPVILPGQSVTITYTLDVAADFPLTSLQSGPELVNTATITQYFGLPTADRAGNPDVRDYPQPGDTGITDDGHVNLDGGRLGDLVWLDLDRDGTQDPGEPGIPGVDVTVTWAGPNNDTDYTDGDEVVYNRTTDANGLWYTDDTDDPDTLLPAGNYRVEVDTSTLPPGLVNVFDPDGTAPTNRSEVNLPDAAENLDQDFGYDGDLSLGDTVWFDIDRSGTQEADEPGINGATVSLLWAGFDGDFSTTADNVAFPDTVTATVGADRGRYTFDQLPSGDFRVTVGSGAGVGLQPTYDYDDGTDDPDGVAVRTLTTASVTDVDFGYAGTGRVGDTVWFDTDANGVQAADEPGISQVDVAVHWAGFDNTFGNADDITVTRTTNALGRYGVNGIPAGQVRVTVVPGTLPGGLTATYDRDGTTVSPDGDTTVTLPAGGSILDIDFGYRGVRTVGDLVWLDVDGDGNGPDSTTGADPTEPGIAGQRVRVVWAGRDGDLSTAADNVVLGAVDTGVDGRWTVDGVPTGTVSATLVGAPANTLRVSHDNEGALDGVGIATVGASDNLTYDFGLAGTGSLGDTVWLDFNRDGVVGPGEPRLPDVDVQVTWAGFDGDLATAGDNVDFGTYTTDADGLYLAEDLPPGRYRATVDPGTLPGGVVPAYDLDGISSPNTAQRVLAQAENARDVDFGYAGEGRIGDFVWWDLNGDGVQDPTEPGLTDVGVTLDWAGFDGVFGNADDGRLTTATGPEGGYLFTGLPAGDYRVTVTQADLPEGVHPTADPDGGDDSTSALTLAGGASNLDQDFGYVGDSEIGDLVWRDTNRDGTRQADEKALKGVGITVRYLGPDGVEDTDDDVVIQQVTGNPPRTEARARGGEPTGDDPFYLVEGLAPGKYAVTLDGDTVKAPDAPISDLDGGNPTITHLTLTDDPELDADFAVFQNDVPTFDGGGAAGAGISVECDGSVRLDPFAFVTDANGDRLRVVKGSIEVPADVVASLNDNGRLVVSTSGEEDFTVRYQVADGRGGVVDVAIPVEVTTECAGGDDGGLPGSGSDVAPWMVG
ncbi:SdrD B-like domain-containing protein, partial [Nocardioides hankookensis]